MLVLKKIVPSAIHFSCLCVSCCASSAQAVTPVTSSNISWQSRTCKVPRSPMSQQQVDRTQQHCRAWGIAGFVHLLASGEEAEDLLVEPFGLEDGDDDVDQALAGLVQLLDLVRRWNLDRAVTAADSLDPGGSHAWLRTRSDRNHSIFRKVQQQNGRPVR